MGEAKTLPCALLTQKNTDKIKNNNNKNKHQGGPRWLTSTVASYELVCPKMGHVKPTRERPQNVQGPLKREEADVPRLWQRRRREMNLSPSAYGHLTAGMKCICRRQM